MNLAVCSPNAAHHLQDPQGAPRPCSYRLAAPEGSRLLELPQSWWDVAAGVSSHLGQAPSQPPPRIFILGNRKVGKSSFCRFLANTLLNVRREVAFMDLDCGQTEFTPPGFLSLKLLTEALLGMTMAGKRQRGLISLAIL